MSASAFVELCDLVGHESRWLSHGTKRKPARASYTIFLPRGGGKITAESDSPSKAAAEALKGAIAMGYAVPEGLLERLLAESGGLW